MAKIKTDILPEDWPESLPPGAPSDAPASAPIGAPPPVPGASNGAPAVPPAVTASSFESEVAYISGVKGNGSLAPTSFWTFQTIPATAHKWGPRTAGSGATITYAFDSASGFTATEQTTFLTALRLWEAVANVKFVESTTESSANFKLLRAAAGSGIGDADVPHVLGSGSTLGRSGFVQTTNSSGAVVETRSQALIRLDTTNASRSLSGDYSLLGGWGLFTIVHEVAHILGLGHGGPYNGAVNQATQQYTAYDDAMWSMMSYVNPSMQTTAKFYSSYDFPGASWGTVSYPHTYMPVDVAAIQRLYGVSKDTQFDGNDTFGFNTTITGLLSKFYDFEQNKSPVVTLWSKGTNNTLDVSKWTMGQFVDLVPGTFSSVGGLTYNLGIAYGTVVETAITGIGNDTIVGNTQNNLLIGGAGADWIDGGTGTDTVSYATSSAAVHVDLGMSLGSPQQGGDAEGDILVSIETVIGSNFDDTMWTGSAGGTLWGRGGADGLAGLDGKDTLHGGSGGDLLVSNGGNDKLYGGQQDLIVNGGFETVLNPNPAGNGYLSPTSTIDGWTVASGPGLELFTEAVVGADPSEGRYAVDLTGVATGTNSTISQVLAAEKGVNYRLAFDVRKLDDASNARLEVSWGGVMLNWGGTPAPYIDPTTSYATWYIDLTGGYGSGASLNKLVFKEIGTATGNGTLLDNVRMYRSTPGAPLGEEDPATDGDDILVPGTGADIVYGNGGNDKAVFEDVGKYSDSYNGGSGLDTLVMNWSTAKSSITYGALNASNSPDIGMSESYRRAPVSGGSDPGQYLWFKEVERFELTGGSADDILKGGDYDDILTGNSGRDSLDGGKGIDVLKGGDGNDTLYGTSGDTLDGGKDFDLAYLSLGGSANNVINLAQAKTATGITLADGTKLMSIEAVNLQTGDGDDFLDVRGTILSEGGKSSTYFDGRGGNDTLAVDLYTSYTAQFIGGAGAGDLLIMDWSADTFAITTTLTASGGYYDSIFGYVVVSGIPHPLSYNVSFTDVERFDLRGGSGNDTLVTLAGDDRIDPGSGAATVSAGAGFDTLVVNWSGLGGYDTTFGSFSGDLASGYSGLINNGANNDSQNRVSYSGVERFEVALGLGNDQLQTGDADDIVSGGGGNDLLRTGKGADVVNGGSEYDRWQADKSNATADIKIDLRVLSNYFVAGIQGSVQGIEVLGVADSDGNRFVTGSGNDVITTLANFDRDFLDTGAGADRVILKAGSDVVRMGADFDTLVIDWSTLGGYDTTFGSFAGTLMAGYDGLINNGANNDAQNRVTYYGVEKFDVSLGLGNDALQTGDADDRVLGGGGNDYLRTGGGADVVDGGAGYDRWVADKSAATAALVINLNVASTYKVGSVTGSVQGIEVLGAGDAAADRFFTGSGNDVITTLANFDRDFLDTGAGNDRVILLAGSDVVRMGDGFDTLVIDWSTLGDYDTTFGSFAGTLMAGYDGLINNGANNDAQNRVTYYGVEKFDVSLGLGNDALQTGDADDRVLGGGGNDYLRTGGGADVVDGGAGYDRWQADKSAATAALVINLNVASAYKVGSVTGSVQGIEVLGAGDAVADRFFTGSGNDVITTLSNFDRDYLDTGAGDDRIVFLAGSDVARMGDGFDTLVIDWSTLGSYDTTFGSFAGTLAAGYDGLINNGANNDAQNRVSYYGVEKFDVSLGLGNDALQTGDADDRVLGGGGNDYLRTGGGADVVDGGAGYDRWQADKSAATADIRIDLGVLSNYMVAGVRGSVQGIEVLGAGDAAADRFFTGSGNDTITTLANFDRDFLDTGAGNDRVVLLAGSDVVRMGAGFDTLVVDWSAASGYDTTFGDFAGSLGGGYDGLINNGANNDGQNRVYYYGVEKFDVSLGAGNDSLFTGDGDDRVSGGAGDDYLRTGGGADIIDGGAGFDRWVADKSAATADLLLDINATSTYTVGAVAGSVKAIEALGAGDAIGDRFVTGSGNDAITTRALFTRDFLDTGAGNDKVTLLAGADVVRLGIGFDTLVVNWSGAGGYDTTFGGLLGSLAAGYDGQINNGANNDGQNRVTFFGVEKFQVALGEGNDQLQTGDGDDTVSGGGGGDYLRTGGGADIVDGGAGYDRWQADKSAATANLTINLNVASTYKVGSVTGSVQGIEVLGAGDSAADRFITGSGNDTITTLANFDRDFLETGAGNDRVVFFAGSDVARMGDGLDTLVVDWSAASGYETTFAAFSGDLATGYEGVINNGANNDGQNRVTYSGVERFEVSLGAGNDGLQTGDGDDTVSGGNGDDYLRTGGGADNIDGGDGFDRWQADKSSATADLAINLTKSSNYTVGGVTARVKNIEALGGGDGVNDRFMTGSGNDTITTRALFKSDFLDTGAGDDRAIVLGGSDVVRMGAGLDTLVVDWSGATGFDTTFGGFAGDLASGYDGLINNGANNDGQNRVAFYAVERFEVSLGEGNDSLQTGDGDDIVSGGAGGDYLRTGGGADTVDGGDGIDRWQADKSAATANLVINLAVLSAYEVAGKAGSVQGIEALGGSDADGDRFVTGTGNDVVTTGTGFLRDIIDSGAGNDTVKLLNGSDIARMGEGDDLLVIDWSGATGFDTYAGIGAGTLAAGYDGLFNNGANNDGQNRAFFFGVERFDASLGEGNDSLQTGDGADRLIGNGGGDTLLAGGGNDFLRGGAGNDTLDGGDGIDTADYSDKSDAVSVTLNGATNATVLVGGVAEDVVRNIENLRGGTGDDNLTGDGLDNQLAGGLGNDVLTGSGGHDRFLFDTVLNKNTNVDTLASFDVAEDTIVLDRTIFAAFANAGALDASAFTIGTGPTAADHRIVYNAATGDLFYDRNGDVSGGTTKFAQLDSGLALTNNNFQIV